MIDQVETFMDANNFFYYPGVGNKETKIYTPDELYHCILARISAGYPAVCSIPSLREYVAENEELCQSEQYIKEKLQKGEIKKYKKELIIAQRETFNYIDFDKISRGNLIKAYVSMTNNSLKNFTQAYGPFHSIVPGWSGTRISGLPEAFDVV